jgi:uncharacterized protein YjiS (DUF1127 family)
MTHIVLTASGWLNAWQEGIYSFIKEIAVKYKARRLAKETINQLQGLNDRELADMGLHRGMIRQLAEEHYQEEVNKNLRGWV